MSKKEVLRTKNGKTAQEGGHLFQQRVQDILSDAEKRHRVQFIRLYDTRSTQGGFLPEQKADFTAVAQGNSWLIEAKASLVHESMAAGRGPLNDLISSHQAAAAKLWVRAGGHSLFVFHHLDSAYVELWPGEYVGEIYVTPRAHLDYQRCLRIPSSEKELAAELILTLKDPNRLRRT